MNLRYFEQKQRRQELSTRRRISTFGRRWRVAEVEEDVDVDVDDVVVVDGSKQISGKAFFVDQLSTQLSSATTFCR